MQKDLLPSFKKIYYFFKIYKNTQKIRIPWILYLKGMLKTGCRFIKAGGKISQSNNDLVYSYSKINFKIHNEEEKFFLEDIGSGFYKNCTIMPSSKILYGFDIILDDLVFTLFDLKGVKNLLGVYKDYKDLPILDRVIIDIGAYEGDSSLFFAMKGAFKVLAFEPNLFFINKSKNIIGVNHLEKVVEFHNAGFGSELFEYDGKESSPSTELWNLTRIASLIQENEDLIGKKISLKIDCEGCEYELFSDQSGLNRLIKLGLDAIIFEYHDRQSRKHGKTRENIAKDKKCLSDLFFNLESHGFRVKNNTNAGPSFGIATFFLEENGKSGT